MMMSSPDRKKIQKAFPSEIHMLSTTSPQNNPLPLTKAILSREFWVSLEMRQTSVSSSSSGAPSTYQELLQNMQEHLQKDGSNTSIEFSSSRQIYIKKDPLSIVFSSKPTAGTKRALLVGVNYDDSSSCSCFNAVETSKERLISKYGFKPSNITELINKDGSSFFPSKYNILTSLKQIVSRSKPGDSAFIQLCGRTVRVEPDKSTLGNNAFVPSDSATKGSTLTPRDFYTSFFCAMPADTHVFVLNDCGESIVALPYSYNSRNDNTTTLLYRSDFDLSAILGLAIIGGGVAAATSSSDGDGCCDGDCCCGAGWFDGIFDG